MRTDRIDLETFLIVVGTGEPDPPPILRPARTPALEPPPTAGPNRHARRAEAAQTRQAAEKMSEALATIRRLRSAWR